MNLDKRNEIIQKACKQIGSENEYIASRLLDKAEHSIFI